MMRWSSACVTGVMVVVVCGWGQPSSAIGVLDEGTQMLCSYRLENAFRPQKFVEMRVFTDGHAEVMWAYYDSDRDQTYRKALQLSPEQVTALTVAYDQMDFLHKVVTDLNAGHITITDVGTTTLIYHGRQGERTLRYGYVEDHAINALVGLYWQILDPVVSAQPN